MKYRVKYRLDDILVEVSGVSGKRPDNLDDNMANAIANGRRLCLERFLRDYKGMTIEHVDGRPRVVGVETEDAWPR